MYMIVIRCKCLSDTCMLWVVDVIFTVIVQYFDPLLHFPCREIVDTKILSIATENHTRHMLLSPL